MRVEQLRNSLTAWLLRKTSGVAVRRVGESSLALTTDVGIVRAENQDRIAVLRGVDPNRRRYSIVALCDGMGGMTDGAICGASSLASFMASFIFWGAATLTPSERLKRAAIDANRNVFEVYRSRGGATLSAVLIYEPKRFHWVNVGDSRIYHRSAEKFTQVTIDDTLEGQFPHADGAEGRNQLLQFIGVGPELEAHTGIVEYNEGDEILLTSDGLHTIDHSLIVEILANSPEPAVGIKRLADLARWRGGHDNATGAMLFPADVARLMSSGPEDPDTIEIWDPYGELQIVQPKAPVIDQRRLKTSEDSSRSDDMAPGEGSLPLAKPSRSSRKRRDSMPQKKGKGVKKEKESKAASEGSRNEVGDKPENNERPQLIIEFQDNDKK